jgi:hypothetical protein
MGVINLIRGPSSAISGYSDMIFSGHFQSPPTDSHTGKT